MRLFITSLMLMVSCAVWGQNKRPDLEIVIGEEIKLKKKELIDKIIGKDEEGTYVMAKYGSEVTLFYYDNDLNQKRKNSFKLEYQNHDLWYKGIVQMKDEFVIFTTYRDKKLKMTYLYSQTLDKDALTFSKPKVLAKASYEGYKKSQSAYYSFTVSADSNYLLFVTDLPSRKDENDRFGFIVYDNEMNEVWSEKEIEIELDEERFTRYDTQIGNDGKVYLLSLIYDKLKVFKMSDMDYSYKMMVYEPDGEGEAEEFDITIEGEHVTDVTFEILDNGNIQVAGFYSTEGLGQNGVFNLLYDADYTISNQSTTEFPTDFIVQHASEKSKKKAKKKEAKGKEIEMYSYSIDELIENDDATITMVAEQYYTYTTSYTDANGNTRTTTHYVFGNIIIVKFDENGDVDWMELIPKRQNSTDGGYYSGYALMQLANGNLVFVFNDNPKNSYYDQSGKFYTWTPNKKNTDVVLFEISVEGQLGRYILYKGADEEVISRPRISVPIDANEMIILGQARKATKFVKLVF